MSARPAIREWLSVMRNLEDLRYLLQNLPEEDYELVLEASYANKESVKHLIDLLEKAQAALGRAQVAAFFAFKEKA
jgi:hypothetical protein